MRLFHQPLDCWISYMADYGQQSSIGYYTYKQSRYEPLTEKFISERLDWLNQELKAKQVLLISFGRFEA